MIFSSQLYKKNNVFKKTMTPNRKMKKKRGKQISSQALHEIWKRYWLSIVGLLALLFFSLLFPGVRALVLLTLLILIGAISMLYMRWVRLSLGLELVTLGFVVTTLIYGPLIGSIVAIISLFLGSIIAGYITFSIVVSFVGATIAAFIISALEFESITTAGIIAVLIYNVIIVPGYIVFGSRVWSTALFSITHISFNIWMFIAVAPGVFSVVKAIA